MEAPKTGSNSRLIGLMRLYCVELRDQDRPFEAFVNEFLRNNNLNPEIRKGELKESIRQMPPCEGKDELLRIFETLFTNDYRGIWGGESDITRLRLGLKSEVQLIDTLATNTLNDHDILDHLAVLDDKMKEGIILDSNENQKLKQFVNNRLNRLLSELPIREKNADQVILIALLNLCRTLKQSNQLKDERLEAYLKPIKVKISATETQVMPIGELMAITSISHQIRGCVLGGLCELRNPVETWDRLAKPDEPVVDLVQKKFARFLGILRNYAIGANFTGGLTPVEVLAAWIELESCEIWNLQEVLRNELINHIVKMPPIQLLSLMSDAFKLKVANDNSLAKVIIGRITDYFRSPESKQDLSEEGLQLFFMGQELFQSMPYAYLKQEFAYAAAHAIPAALDYLSQAKNELSSEDYQESLSEMAKIASEAAYYNGGLRHEYCYRHSYTNYQALKKIERTLEDKKLLPALETQMVGLLKLKIEIAFETSGRDDIRILLELEAVMHFLLENKVEGKLVIPVLQHMFSKNISFLKDANFIRMDVKFKAYKIAVQLALVYSLDNFMKVRNSHLPALLTYILKNKTDSDLRKELADLKPIISAKSPVDADDFEVIDESFELDLTEKDAFGLDKVPCERIRLLKGFGIKKIRVIGQGWFSRPDDEQDKLKKEMSPIQFEFVKSQSK